MQRLCRLSCPQAKFVIRAVSWRSSIQSESEHACYVAKAMEMLIVPIPRCASCACVMTQRADVFACVSREGTQQRHEVFRR